MGINDFMERCKEMASGEEEKEEKEEENKKKKERLDSAQEKINQIKKILEK